MREEGGEGGDKEAPACLSTPAAPSPRRLVDIFFEPLRGIALRDPICERSRRARRPAPRGPENREKKPGFPDDPSASMLSTLAPLLPRLPRSPQAVHHVLRDDARRLTPGSSRTENAAEPGAPRVFGVRSTSWHPVRRGDAPTMRRARRDASTCGAIERDPCDATEYDATRRENQTETKCATMRGR